MKVALIVPGGFDPGGRENTIPALLGLARELAHRHDVHVFAFGGPGPITRYRLVGATIHQLGDASRVDPPRPARSARLLARVGWQLSRELIRAASPIPFDVLHAFWAMEPGLLAGLLGRLTRVPAVVTVGGGEAVWIPEIRYGGAGSAIRRAVTWSSLRLAQDVTIGSAFARSFLTGRDGARARVVPLGISCETFRASPARPAGPPWRLLHVGSITPVKDHGTLLDAFARVVARVGDVTLDCVGEDTLGGRMQARARALGLGPRVRFHGFLPNDELVGLYRGCHLHVVSSLYESQAVVVLEAAAAALPTVGTAVGLLPTLAPDAASCVPTGAAGALADAISALLNDESRRQAMGNAAQAFACAHDVSWTARTFEGRYRELTSGAGAPRVRDTIDTSTSDLTDLPAPGQLAPSHRRGGTVWLTGRPASGKTTTAVALDAALRARGVVSRRIDGDVLRQGPSRDLGFSKDDRAENARRATLMAVDAARSGEVAIVSLITPYAADRLEARRLHERAGLPFIEVHVDCPLALAEARDPKRLYQRARAGQLQGVTGIDAPYETPVTPELTLDTSALTVQQGTRLLLEVLGDLATVSS